MNTRIRLSVCALVGFFAVSFPATVARAIVMDSDNSNLETNGWIPIVDQPPLGLRPYDDLAVGINDTSSQSAFWAATPIAPNYIVTASHLQPSNWLDMEVWVGRDEDATFKVVDAHSFLYDASLLNGGQSLETPTGPGDVIVLKIEPIDEFGPSGLSDWVSLSGGNELVGMPFAVGSYGPQQKRDISDPGDPELVGSPSSNGGLAWGRNRLTSVGGELFARYDSPLDEGHIDHEISFLIGDSGSGWYVKDGWEWKVAGHSVSEINGVLGTGGRFGIAENREWIINAVEGMGGSVPSSAPGDALPTPTKTFTGSGIGGDWNSSSKWNPSGVPTDSDIVSVSHATKAAAIGAGNAEAFELFVGAGGVQGKITQSFGGTLSVADSIYFGPQASDTGLYDGEGNITAKNIYVGVYGESDVHHWGGDIEAEFVVVGAKAGSDGYLQLVGNNYDASLNARTVVVGRDSGSTAELFIQADNSNAELTADQLLVGYRGEGTMYHVDNAVVDVLQLIVGKEAGSEGTYEMYGAAVLTTDRTIVGEAGTAVFGQFDGTHTTEELHLNAASTYTLVGGALNATQTTIAKGTIDFDDEDGTFTATGIIDLGEATLSNTGSATLEVDNDSLLIVPQSFNPATAFDTYTLGSGSVLHHEGDTLTIANGKSVVGYGTIRDDIVVEGNGSLEAGLGGQLFFNGDLTITDEGTVSLGYRITASNGAMFNISQSQTLDLRDGTFQTSSIFVHDGGTLTVNGDIYIQNSANASGGLVGDVLSIQEGGTLVIGPGVAEINMDGRFELESGSLLKMDIGGTGLIDSDGITVLSNPGALTPLKPTVNLEGDLELHFVNEYTPAIGDEIYLLAHNGYRNGSFDDITHDGPAGMGIERVFESGAPEDYKLFSVRFVSLTQGDMNFDGDVDADDIDILWHIVRGTNGWSNDNTEGDLNDDLYVNEDDVDYMLANLLDAGTNRAYGDANLDGVVDGDDYDLWFAAAGDGWAHGDFNGDGSIDNDDYVLWQTEPTEYPYEVGPHGDPFAPVPEPSTVALLALGVPAMVAMVVRRRRKPAAN